MVTEPGGTDLARACRAEAGRRLTCPSSTIDGRETVTVDNGATVMEAANELGIYMPHFCYHKKLSIAANCRMCLVQVEKAPKPQPACATPGQRRHESVHALGLMRGRRRTA